MAEVAVGERRYRVLRKQLDELGYLNPLVLEAVPLVEKLTSDLLQTTESLCHYKQLACRTLEEQSLLKHGVEPYRLENAKLVRECNELHIQLLKNKEEVERSHQDLRSKIRKLQSENSDLKFLSSQHLLQVKELERESAAKTAAVARLQPTVIVGAGGRKAPLRPRPCLEIDAPLEPPSKGWKRRFWSATAQARDPHVVSMVEVCDQRICALSREVNLLKEERVQQSERISFLESQLQNRDREIERLTSMLEGGRPSAAVNKDYSVREINQELQKSKGEIRNLETERQELEVKLKESAASCHEAMARAMRLAEQNKKLETELRDMDHVALKVEAECSSTVKENTKKVARVQERLDQSLAQVHRLEREVLELCRAQQEQQAELDKLRFERQRLQRLLDAARDERRKLTERISSSALIEKDLTTEVDRLAQLTSLQARRITELEARLLQRLARFGASPGLVQEPGPGGDAGSALLLMAERDCLRRELEQLKQQLASAAEHPAKNAELRRRLGARELDVRQLQMHIQELAVERQGPPRRADVYSYDAHGPGLAAVVRRYERERDMARGDIERLEEERNALRERLKVATETQVVEHARLEKTVLESEDRVRRLEAERRELMAAAGGHKATIANLQELAESLREQLCGARSELAQQRSLYAQVKALQEQTDRALGDSQCQLAQLETELANAQERVRGLEGDRAALDREVSDLRTEQALLRGSLARLDQEKDELLLSMDSKTEKNAQLEQQLKARDVRLIDLEDSLTELRKKLEITLDENQGREQAVRQMERDAEALRLELEAVERTREGTLRDNRRLQDDLAAAAQDARAAQRELEAARGEAEALRRQVQDYVAEIRRVEDMLAQKESERSEMLEQFRGLSMEATLLENNNHSLETEAAESKGALRDAQQRITDLEQRLQARESLARSYESQIAELTAHVAGLESQLQAQEEQRCKTEVELGAMRELCVKLDVQKDSLQQQNTDHDVEKIHLEGELARLREEQELMQEQLCRDRSAIGALEAALDAARNEAAEQRVRGQELAAEAERLHGRVDSLQARLDGEQAELRRYQAQASDYSRQVAELQRQLTNERFERARAADESRSCSQEEPAARGFSEPKGRKSSTRKTLEAQPQSDVESSSSSSVKETVPCLCGVGSHKGCDPDGNPCTCSDMDMGASDTNLSDGSQEEGKTSKKHVPKGDASTSSEELPGNQPRVGQDAGATRKGKLGHRKSNNAPADVKVKKIGRRRSSSSEGEEDEKKRKSKYRKDKEVGIKEKKRPGVSDDSENAVPTGCGEGKSKKDRPKGQKSNVDDKKRPRRRSMACSMGFYNPGPPKGNKTKEPDQKGQEKPRR